MHEFALTSTLSAAFGKDLEALMFFNPQQQIAGAGVIRSIERYGTPRIAAHGGQLRVSLGHSDVQQLFALDESGDLAGMVLYLRTDGPNVIVLHLAVTEQYSASGQDGDAMLVLRLLQAVVDSARRLKGVRFVTILYSHRARVVRIVRDPGALRAAG